MINEEIDFPRGGKKQKSSEVEGEPGAGIKAKERNKKKQLSGKRQNAEESPFDRPSKKFKKDIINVEGPLQDDTLCTGLVVLACVKQVNPHNVIVGLPGNLTASVPITNISEAYSEQLNQISEDKSGENEIVASVTDFIKPGLFLPVVLKSIEQDKQKKRKLITGSFKPSDINSDVLKSEVQNGMLLMGNVSSVEDHGYRIDTGIKGLHAFLKNTDAENHIEKYCSSEKFCVGTPLWCVVSMKGKKSGDSNENRVINVMIEPDMIEKAKMPPKFKMNSLLPGMKVTAHVKQIGQQGLLVTFGPFEGILHGSHLPTDVQSYSAGSAIDAALLYVHPESKTIHLSGLDKIVKQNGCAVDNLSGVEIGDTFDAKIQRQIRKKGIYLKLPRGRKGFAALSQLTDDTTVPDINDFKAGETVQCRALGFNYMENVVLVTLKKSVLAQKFITVKSLKPGEFVEGTIVDVLPSGVLVTLSKKIYSFIPNIHMTNVPITQLNKKFESGMTLKCRVMHVNVAKSKVSLTHKPTLLNTKHLIPTGYSQLKPNAEVMGVISVVKAAYVIVRFFNKVQGIVGTSEMGLEQNQSPLESFYKGQVVRCRVVYVNADDEQLKLSFNFTKKKSEKNIEMTIQEPLNLNVGMVTKAKVVSVGKDSYKVVLLPDKYPAILPFDHLSDYPDIQQLKKLVLSKGDLVPNVTFFDKKHQCRVTMKECLLKGAGEKLFVESFDDLQVGMLLPGVVKNHQDYGFFVELAGGHTGLCPARAINTVEPSALRDHYPEGRSVLTRIVKIDKDKGRFLASVAKQDCVKSDQDDLTKLLQEYLQNRDGAVVELVKKNGKLKPYGDVSVGSLVEVTVTSIYKKGVLCETSSGLKAIATQDHFGGIKPETGKSYSAVVLDVDLLSPCVEVTLDSRLCKSVQTRVENTSSQVKIGQVLKGELLLLKQEFLLMKLKGHGSGKLVYIPAKQHFNDSVTSSPHKIGMYSDVVIKGNVDGTLIGALKVKERKSNKSSKVSENENISGKDGEEDGKENVDVKNLQLHCTQVGDVIEAKVKTVYPLQMNIAAGHVHGRVHITEVSDAFTERKNPLHNYHPGDTVQAKVIGLRTMKSQSSYMPITKGKTSRTLLECTLRESKMEVTDPKELLHEELSTFIGAEMTVFVIKVDEAKLWVQASLMHQGSISMFQVSDNLDVINNIYKHFKVGQALKATVVGKTDNDKITFSLTGQEVELKVGANVTALVTGVKNSECLSVRLYNGSMGVVESLPNDSSYSTGKYIRCKVMSVSGSGVYKLCLSKKSKERKRKASLTLPENEQVAEKKGRKDSLTIDEETPKPKVQKKVAEKEHAVAQVGEKASILKAGSSTQQSSMNMAVNDKNNKLTIHGFAWGGDLQVKQTRKDINDDDEDDEDIDKITAVIDNKSRRKRNREQEKMIEEYEKQQIEGNVGPQNVNDFERMVLQSPNSSMVWLGYMAYHLNLGEVAKARTVAEKALNTIVFREEQEKKNVWLAYLNLEAMYGDSEDLKSLLQRAITYNDPLDIQLKMCDIYIGANKIEDAEQLYNVLIRKFKKEKSVWKSYAQFLYKQDRQESARNILTRCLTALEKRDHVEVISRFANLEFSHGNPERGRTILENLIASYPKRIDLWSMYVDMVVKSGDITGARLILERAMKKKLNTKKTFFLIQKFIRFEETHGTEDQVQRVKDMAVSIFNS